MVDKDRQGAGAEVVALVPWQRSLHRARRADRAFAPTGRADPRELAENDAAIAAATPLEAYYAIKQRGLAEAIPVLSVLTREQIQTLFDLELWKGDTLEIPDLLSWLEGFRIAGHAAVVKASRALDPEALATLFRRRLLIAHTPDDQRSDDGPTPEWLLDPPPEIEPIVQTPDGRFMIAARLVDERDELDGARGEIDEEERKQVLELVRELYLDEGWEFVAGILRMAGDDLTSAMEEDGLRFRDGRVEDLGFPPLQRALQVYGLLDPSALGHAPVDYPILPDARLPLVHVEVLAQGLLEAALRRLDGPTVARVEGDLLAVANSMLVADRVDAGDLDAIEAGLARARANIELGLAYGTSLEARVDVAGERLARLHPQTLFRVGYTLTQRLAARARAVATHAGLGDLGRLAWSSAERGVLEALMRPRPMFDRALEARIEDPAALLDEALADVVRPFETPDDLEVASAFLAESEQLAAALEATGLMQTELEGEVLPSDPAEHDIDLRLATAGAQALLGAPFEVVPLTADQIEDLVDGLGLSVSPPRFDRVALAGDAARARDGEHGDALERRVLRVLGALAEAWLPMVGQERLDLRFVEGVARRPRASA